MLTYEQETTSLVTSKYPITSLESSKYPMIKLANNKYPITSFADSKYPITSFAESKYPITSLDRRQVRKIVHCYYKYHTEIYVRTIKSSTMRDNKHYDVIQV